jgi:hypothetical protein
LQFILWIIRKTILNGGLFECLDREASDEEKQQYDKDKAIRPVKSAIRIDGFSDNPKNVLLIFIDKIILITINIGGKIISIIGFAISGSTKTPVFFPTI